jgi:hypothetical protein
MPTDACGLAFEALRARQCGRAYSGQDLEFLLRHCRDEAWSLARAQCDRNLRHLATLCRVLPRLWSGVTGRSRHYYVLQSGLDLPFGLLIQARDDVHRESDDHNLEKNARTLRSKLFDNRME